MVLLRVPLFRAKYHLGMCSDNHIVCCEYAVGRLDGKGRSGIFNEVIVARVLYYNPQVSKLVESHPRRLSFDT